MLCCAEKYHPLRADGAQPQRVREKGYRVCLYYIGLDTAEESKNRIANRAARGGHTIPEKDVERQFRDRWTALQAVLPFCDDVFFFDNSNGFTQAAVCRNGELIPEGSCRPQWITELFHLL